MGGGVFGTANQCSGAGRLGATSPRHRNHRRRGLCTWLVYGRGTGSYDTRAPNGYPEVVARSVSFSAAVTQVETTESAGALQEASDDSSELAIEKELGS